jgi:hypothetical protein
MKLTIIPSDKAVYVDGYSFLDLDLVNIPEDVHALQWNQNVGEIEFVQNADGVKLANQVINSLPSWAEAAIEVWNKAKNANPIQS